MRVLVTGGAGFVGAHVVLRLLRSGARVGVLDDFSTGRPAALRPAFEAGLHESDVLTADVAGPGGAAMIEAWRPEVVIHLAAQARVASSIADPLHDARTNVVGTVALLTAAQRCGTRRIISASSGGTIYGHPDNDQQRIGESQRRRPVSPYGLSKVTADEYLRLFRELHGVPSLSLALGNVYGKGCDGGTGAGVIGRFVDDLLAGRAPTVTGDGRQTRDFVHVDDVAEAFVLACAGTDEPVVNIGSGVRTRIIDALSLVAAETGTAIAPVHVAAAPGEVHHNCLDPGLAGRALGWSAAVSLPEGIRRLVDFARTGGDRRTARAAHGAP